MPLFDLLSELGRKASAALAAALGDSDKIPAELSIVKAGKPEFGDFQISGCLPLGKALGKPPRELAGLVKQALEGHPALSKIEIAGPGFVNLHLADAWFAREAAALANDPRLGLRQPGAGKRVVLDYSSPNVAKPMHVGHIRSTIVGSALLRVLRALGYHVIADNHIGDWGTQFGKLIVAWRKWLDVDAYSADPVKELERLYQKFGADEQEERKALGAQLPAAAPEVDADAAEEDVEAAAIVTPLMQEARRELVKLQQGDPENRALWQRFVDDSRHVFEDTYQRLGVTFDYWLGESAYNEMLPIVVADLQQRGIAIESRGALIVQFPEATKLPIFMIRKGDGGYNYATTDLATMAVRTGTPPWPHMPAGPFFADRVIICTDERQQLHFKQLFAVSRALGITAELEHVWFGLMRFWSEEKKEWEAGSTRKGNVMYLKALLDEAERRARVVAEEHFYESDGPTVEEDHTRRIGEMALSIGSGKPIRNPISAERLDEIARVVGIGAVKYNDLSKDRQTLVSFTWDRALALQGNTAPYLQYAYARIRSIMRKAGEEPRREPVILTSLVERDLAKRLLAYPEAVEQVARTLRPHLLCDYLFELSTAFSGFYADHPVLKAEPAVRASRLLLTELCARVLQHGLALLGIEVLDRM